MPDRSPDAAPRVERPRPRANATLAALGLAALAAVSGLVALGSWQVARRAWKHDLIARVEARIGAPPAPAPSRGDWPGVSAQTDAYRAVTATGTFLTERETLVQAVTALGGGFWVMTPLRVPDGTIVLVNRGFVPADRRGPAGARGAPPGETRVTGLLRTSEPGGAFLRSNDPGAERWYSRDVAAIAAARGLAEVAPYFIDADAETTADAEGVPVGGLTVVAFSDNHLVYAATWFVLAAMVACAYGYVVLDERRTRRAAGGGRL